jgi:hypothetical protein
LINRRLPAPIDARGLRFGDALELALTTEVSLEFREHAEHDVALADEVEHGGLLVTRVDRLARSIGDLQDNCPRAQSEGCDPQGDGAVEKALPGRCAHVDRLGARRMRTP